MTEPVTLLTDEVQAWVGATAVYTAPEELTRASIRAFELALGSDPDHWHQCRSTDADI